jgi:hypothetical protein
MDVDLREIFTAAGIVILHNALQTRGGLISGSKLGGVLISAI